ncbi:39S ribosomal protein L44, mitochondrial-like [Mizuhopecten yessoensis]|uniref:Large ribosomal subunit protein mL44 n=1 Tax=Mizuhopecten yessoensis TaxID=6573 RepID=A0A210R2H8_MIZYE|nr:39S ribosomal protein L44, mitochondrial-like [Mizuhopecten yessoensis]OWF55290.1 39S ribosomal protein L44, mitochondrial [Mizuhopecten yessoensis]
MATRMCMRLHLMRKSKFLTDRPTAFLKDTCTRTLKTYKSRRPVLSELFHKRQSLGPEPERHPSAYGIWNYDSEVYAFGKRLGEDFKDEILKTSLVLRSYQEEDEKAKEILLDDYSEENDDDDNTVSRDSNEQLAKQGEKLASRYVKAYLRATYPEMFEEGISAVHDYLTSDEMFAYVGSQLGLKDIILKMDYPPTDEDYSVTMKAVIGALAASQDVARAEAFVRDFFIVQLVAEDINEIWDVINPMGVLTNILKKMGLSPPEPRLIWKSAASTVMSVYHVGLYSDRTLLGRAPGETVSIAEEMAARDALKKYMNTQDHRAPLKFREAAEKLQIDYDRKNASLSNLSSGS